MLAFFYLVSCPHFIALTVFFLSVHRLLRDKVQALEDTVRAYHSIAEDMKMIPVTARNSRGENLVIELGMLYTSYTI